MNRTLVALTLCLAAACSDAPKLQGPPPAPAIVAFTASSSLVKKGDSVKLTWKTTDATDVSLTAAGGAPTTGLSAEGTQDVTVSETTLFVLTASGVRGIRASAPLLVQVEGQAQSVFFAALPSTVKVNETANLVWSAPGAQALSLAVQGGAPLDLGGQGSQGVVTVSPTQTTTYAFTADGTTRTATVTLAATIDALTLSAGQALPGEMLTVHWKTSGGTKVTLDGAGRGVLASETDLAKVKDGTFTDTVPTAPDGTVLSYRLTLEGSGGPVSQELRAVVGTAPAVLSFTAPDYSKLGGQVSLAWRTANADTVTVEAGGVVLYRAQSLAEAKGGALSLPVPAADTEYLVRAASTISGASATRTVTVHPVGVVTATLTATPGTVAKGGDPITLTWTAPWARHLKLVDSFGHVLASVKGAQAESGTATAYANQAMTFTALADNTLDAPVSATAGVQVTTPAAFGPPATPFLVGDVVPVTWTVGTSAPLVGYPHPDVVAATGSTGFVDISGTGTRVAFLSTDDSVLRVDVPDFSTFLFGEALGASFYASTNGFFVFATTSPSSRATTVAIPNTTIEPNFVAPYWADLQLGTGAVYWQVQGTAPDKVLVVQWNRVIAKGQAQSELTFEAKVSQSGQVTFEYKKLTLTTPVTHVIGVQGRNGVGVPAGGEAEGTALTLFGPKTSPYQAAFAGTAAQSGFLKLGQGYLRVSAAPASLVTPSELGVSELMYAPDPSLDGGEWLEVSNRASGPLDLGGATVDFGNGQVETLPPGTMVPAQGSLLLAQSLDLADPDAGLDAGYQYDAGITMAKDAGTVTLRLRGLTSSATYQRTRLGDGGTGVSAAVDLQPHLVSGDLSSTVPHPVTFASTSPFGTLGQLGTPGRFQPFLFTMQSIPVSFRDLSDSGVALFVPDAGDEASAQVPLDGGTFPFLGTVPAVATVNANGWLALKPVSVSSSFTNKSVPSASAPSGSVLAPFWDDLADPAANGAGANVYWRRLAANEDPQNPGAHWIIQWSHATFFSSLSAPADLNFEVKLFDTGVIEFHYGGLSSQKDPARAAGGGATVWVEGLSGLQALVKSVNKPLVQPGTALRFTPGN